MLEKIKDLILYLITTNLFLANILIIILIISFVLIISSLFENRKVVLKRKNDITLRKRFSTKIDKVINKINRIKSIRDNLANDIALITQKNNTTNKIYANDIIGLLVFIFVAILIFSFVFFKNVIVKISIPIIVITLIIALLNKRIDNKRDRARKDIPKVIKVYTSAFAYDKNSLSALEHSLKFLPQSHKGQFLRLIESIRSQTDYESAVNEYAQRINEPMCYAFAETLKTSRFDTNGALDGLLELQNLIKIEDKRKMSITNKIRDKKLTMIICPIAVITVIAFERYLAGSAITDFFLNSIAGQIILLVAAIIMVFTAIASYVISKL